MMCGTLRPWRFLMLLPVILLDLPLLLVQPPVLADGAWLLRQGVGLVAIWGSARPARELRGAPGTDPGLVRLLDDAEDMRTFARNFLGLRTGDNYTGCIVLDHPWVARVVSSCGPFDFRPRTWEYPLLGALPYKGFFDPDEAQSEVRHLQQQGLETVDRGVQAFSTLGMLPDPLFSFMADWSSDDLACTIFHELTHATVYLPGEGGFNESLASFAGEEGLREYRAFRSGQAAGSDAADVPPGDALEAPGMATDAAGEADSRTFGIMTQALRSRLEAIYTDPYLDAEKKRTLKAAEFEAFRAFFAGPGYDRIFRTPDWRGWGERPLNNALLSLWGTYDAGTDDFALAWASRPDKAETLGQFVIRMARNHREGRPLTD